MLLDEVAQAGISQRRMHHKTFTYFLYFSACLKAYFITGGFKVSDIRSRELDDLDNARYIFQIHYHLLPIIPELVKDYTNA